MKRRYSIALAAILALTLAVPASAAGPERPFRGWSSGEDSMGPPTGCPAEAQWRYGSDGYGQFTHLGRTHFVVDHCSWMTGPTTGAFGSGTITFTAANGDTLVVRDWGTFELTMGPTGPIDSAVTLHWEVVSGTGRFANASGHGGGSPYSDLATGITSATFWGEISY